MEVLDNTSGHLLLHWMRQVHRTLTVDVRVPTHHILIVCHHLLGIAISARQECQLVKGLIALPFMLMIPCGMVKVVVQLAHAAHSIIHRGFVNNCLSQLMLI